MQKRAKIKFLKLLTVLVCTLICMKPMVVDASWIDRDASGIYYGSGDSLGQGIGELDEEDNAEEEELDDGTNFFIELVNKVGCWVITSIGRSLFELLDLVGASLDTLIYGRLVADTTLFTFDLGTGNIYGIVGAAIYGVLGTITLTLLIPIFMGKIAFSAWKRGDYARSSLNEAISFFVFALLLLILTPFFLDMFLFIRDVILYLIGTEGATSLFGSGSSTSIINVLSRSANENILSALIFVAAVVLNLYFMIGYVGIALSMTTNFFLFPFVLIKMAFDRQVLKEWIWEMITCMLAPVIDAVLIMIPSFLGVYASQLTALEAVGIALIQLIICYLIIPIRTYARGRLGLKVNPLENSGIAAASILGMTAARGIRNAFTNSRDAKKNAQMDRERADMEEDMAQLEKDSEDERPVASNMNNLGKQMASADEIREMMGRRNGQNGADNIAEDLNESINGENPLGQEQSYAGGLESHIASQEEELNKTPLPEEASLTPEERLSNAQKKKELDEKLEQAQTELNALEKKKNEVLNDDSLSEEERAEKLGAINDAISAQKELSDSINKDRESVMSVDDKIRAAQKRRSQLEDAYNATAKDTSLEPDEREGQLDSLNNQIKDADQEIEGLQRQKQKLNLELEKEALAKEPATLRNELDALKSSNETLNLEKEDLIRQRERLREEQSNYEVGTSEHTALGSKIQSIEQQIGAHDQEISDNIAQQNTISNALAQQQAGLYDRQAYNLHERVKAQSAYDKARMRVDEMEQAIKAADSGKASHLAVGTEQRRSFENELKSAKADMAEAKSRLGELSQEDRRIAARLHEISPDLNQYTFEDVKAAKSAQAVKRASIQKEIAGLQEKMVNDPYNKRTYREQIARLQSEVADCNHNSARLDQIMEGLRSTTGGGRRSDYGAGSIGGEYERKRAAIMERYANIDNFESPDFSGISRERKAQLYRERALRTQKIWNRNRIGNIVGTVAGGTMGIWLGSSGVIPGAMIGHALGGELGINSALRYMEHAASRPVDYSNKPLDFHVSADYRDNTISGQQRTVERVQAELRESLSTERFQNAVTSEMLSNDLVQQEIKSLFIKHNVTKDNYAAKRDVIIKELQPQLLKTVENAESRVIEMCAGKEYANLSNDVKRHIIGNVAKPNMDVFQDLCEGYYLCKEWQPYYGEYLDD